MTANLIESNKKMIMDNITPHIGIKTNVIYSFKSEIHRGAGEIVPHHKTLITNYVWRRFKHILMNVNKNGWIWITKKYCQSLIYPSK